MFKSNETKVKVKIHDKKSACVNEFEGVLRKMLVDLEERLIALTCAQSKHYDCDERLRYCRFCCMPKVRVKHILFGGERVVCGNCGMKGVEGDSQKEAIRMWWTGF